MVCGILLYILLPRLLHVTPNRQEAAHQSTVSPLTAQLMAVNIKQNFLLDHCNLLLTTPCNLQYIAKKELKDDLELTVSDGTHSKDFLISKRFAFLFRAEKIMINSVITILEIKKKKNKQIIMEIRLNKQVPHKRFGDPKNL